MENNKICEQCGKEVDVLLYTFDKELPTEERGFVKSSIPTLTKYFVCEDCADKLQNEENYYLFTKMED